MDTSLVSGLASHSAMLHWSSDLQQRAPQSLGVMRVLASPDIKTAPVEPCKQLAASLWQDNRLVGGEQEIDRSEVPLFPL